MLAALKPIINIKHATPGDLSAYRISIAKNLLQFVMVFSALTILAGCGRRGCGLSDQEIIDISIEYYLSHQQGGISDVSPDGVMTTYETESYINRSQFDLYNKNCCAVVQTLEDFGGPSLWEKLWYGFHGYVIVHTMARAKVNGYLKIVRGFPYVSAVDSCGRRIPALNFWEGR